MKRYSKEWWLNIATTVIRDFELCSFDNGIPHITFRQTYDWDDEDLDLFTNYCFKRYAEAYYKEKSWEDFTEEFDEVGKAQKIVGRLEERERILGIIEERAAHYRHKKRSTPFAGYRQVLIEREVELKELIEKIKG